MKFEVPKRQMRTLAQATDEEQAAIVDTMTVADMLSWDGDFESWAHEAQLPPPDNWWRVWLMMAGRGFGKTRAGAEWVEKLARSRPGMRIALAGATIDEARRVMVEGVSGILAVAARRRHRVRWEPSLGRLKWPNGSEAQLFSGDNPEGLRGPSMTWRGALLALDAVVAGAVDEAARNEPPSPPAPGACYLVGENPTGSWAGYPDHLAAFSAAGWRFVAPVIGLNLFVKSTGTVATYLSSGWDIGSLRATKIEIEATQVVGPQEAAIADPIGGSTVDFEARSCLEQVLASLRAHGLIAT